MLHIIDSYAWIEYFIGSNKGEILKKLFLDDKNSFLTMGCCLAEIKGLALKNNRDFNQLYKIIKANSRILAITERDWIDTAKERFEQRKKQKDFGLIDAVILVKQKELNCKIVSGDKHFKDMKDVIFMR
ncbi:MAG: PIN domain-containing protein [Nanoarchaeota archaeon]